MTVGRYARLRDVYKNTIIHAVRTGLIHQDPNGMIDSDQADASWWVQHQARLRSEGNNRDQDDRMLQARVASRLSKVQLAKSRLEAREQTYVPRAEVLSGGLEQAELVTTALAAVPDRFAWVVAEVCEIDEARAKALLAEFVQTTAIELGDLMGDARTAAAML